MKITAPASTANLGPGFDCLAGALSIGLRVTAHEGSGAWNIAAPDGEESIVAPELMLRAAGAVAGELPSLVGSIESEIPIGAGLGSSAAIVAAGLLLGCAVARLEPDPAELLELGTPLEGHPDNLAAALFGGLTLALPWGEGVLRAEPASAVRPFVLLSGERLPTAEARKVLPDELPRQAAVANAARAAGLFGLLTGAVLPTREALLACTEDLVHQPYRAPLMPGTAAALERLRTDGVAAAVSGAGPSIVCLVLAGDEDVVRDRVRGLGGWELMELRWGSDGARIVEDR